MLATAAASGLGSSSQQQGGGGGECAAPKPPCARVVPVPILSDNYAYLVIDVRLAMYRSSRGWAFHDPTNPPFFGVIYRIEGMIPQSIGFFLPPLG